MLSIDICSIVVQYLPIKDLITFMSVTSAITKICSLDVVWHIHMSNDFNYMTSISKDVYIEQVHLRFVRRNIMKQLHSDGIRSLLLIPYKLMRIIAYTNQCYFKYNVVYTRSKFVVYYPVFDHTLLTYSKELKDVVMPKIKAVTTTKDVLITLKSLLSQSTLTYVNVDKVLTLNFNPAIAENFLYHYKLYNGDVPLLDTIMTFTIDTYLKSLESLL